MFPLSRNELKEYVAARKELEANFPVIERTLRKWVPYEQAVAINETRIFARHIAEMVKKASCAGIEHLDIPVLPRKIMAFHMPDGNLNHANPGPVQYEYVPKVIEILAELLPGVEVKFSDKPMSESFIKINWA
jgi:hypothetical protein